VKYVGDLTTQAIKPVGDMATGAMKLVQTASEALGILSPSQTARSPEAAWASRPSVVSWNTNGLLPRDSSGFVDANARAVTEVVGAEENKWAARPSVVSWNTSGRLPQECISVKRDLVYRQKRPSIWQQRPSI
jgi:hypothetical protein